MIINPHQPQAEPRAGDRPQKELRIGEAMCGRSINSITMSAAELMAMIHPNAKTKAWIRQSILPRFGAYDASNVNPDPY